MRTSLVLVLILMGTGASAQELPKDLLLKCEGKSSMKLVLDGKPEFHSLDFSHVIRLHDRTISYTSTNIPLGKDCALKGENIRCELNVVFPYNKEVNNTEKRHSIVMLNRLTGEFQSFLETWGYPRREASGSPSSTAEVTNKGICRTISKALF